METKICKICNNEKNLLEFHKRVGSKDGVRNECKKCYRILINEYRQKNKESVNKLNRESYYKHIEKRKKSSKEYRDNNKEKIREYFIINREIISKKQSERLKKRKETDDLFRLVCSMRARFSGFLKANNITKKNKTFDIVGCTPEELRLFLEAKFVEGMTWENYGKKGWSVDHIIPLSSAKTEEEIYKLCHYTNLQPLWEPDNIRKYNKII
jgi:hypothetical protein